MKKIYIAVIALQMFLVSCNDWLEPNIEDEITTDQMYQSGDGYRAVLNGLYKAMGKSPLYGRELSFGFLDCLSQQYKLDEKAMPTYFNAACFQYQNKDVRAVLDGIWLTAYNIIASANDLIQHGEQASPEVFKDGESERDLIVGEAYACRALMHFEMLRLFGPAPDTKGMGEKVNVPYVSSFPTVQPEANLTMEAFLNKCIEDLRKGQKLVASTDTTEDGLKRIKTVTERFYSTEGNLYSGRGYHLNYYAYTPYFNDAQFWMLEGVSDWNKKDGLRLPYSLIFAVNNKDVFEESDISSYFPVDSRGSGGEQPGGDGEITTSQLLVIDRGDIFNQRINGDESMQDYRSTLLIYNVGGAIPVSGKWYASTDAAIRAKNLFMLPVLRVSEMSYIQAEVSARNGDYETATRILNQLRNNRGIWDPIGETEGNPIQIASWEDFVRELVADARREWISEGQLFYLYKRLGPKVKLITGEVRTLKREEITIPVPEDQRF